MKDQFIGTGVALATPFKANLSVDFEALEKLLVHVSKGGVDYLVINGTTGEAPTLTPGEKKEVLDFIIQHNAGRLPIVFGITGNDTQRLTTEIKAMDFKGIDGILSACPYYNRPGQEGLYQHFVAVAESSPVPVILYNVPFRTSSNLEAATTLRLAAHQNIIAIKEASGNLLQNSLIACNGLDDFLLISGDDLTTLPLMAVGARGVISVMANAVPGPFSRMVRSALDNDFQEAIRLHKSLVSLGALLGEEGNPTGIKQAMELLNIGTSTVRPPLQKASTSLKERLQLELTKMA